MCGRFTLSSPAEVLAALFAVDSADWNDPRYNIAPQVRVVTVRGQRTERRAQSLLWGALNPRDGRPLINARSETAASSPLFSRAFAGSRVLIPADGFFEWTKSGAMRLGRFFQRPDRQPFAFAGLAVSPPAGGPREEPAAVILTTAASGSVKEFHDRMPVLVACPDFDDWLDTNCAHAALDIVARGTSTEWISHSVGPSVNNVRNDSAENIQPREPLPEPQGRLF